MNFTIVLNDNGTVVAWGRNHLSQTNVPAGLSNVTAIAAGGHQSMALRSNGVVTNWGNTFGTIPTDLTNAMAIAAGTDFCLALRSNKTIAVWGNNSSGQTNIPTAASNVVAIAAGKSHALAVREDGHVISWGSLADVPSNLTNAMSVAAGNGFSMVLRNDGTVIAWGDNSGGQTNVITNLPPVKFIAAGSSNGLVALYSPFIQYPVDVSKDLLLIYNTNSADSIFVKDYYLAHRPMVANANVLAIGCVTNEIIDGVEFTNNIFDPYLNWLNQNPTKHPGYIVIFLDIATRVYSPDNFTSLSVRLRDQTPGVTPFVTHINMNGTNDCKGYIDKLEFIGTNYSPGRVILSANAGGYGNTNYVIDNIRSDGYTSFGWVLAEATNALLTAGIISSAISYVDNGGSHLSSVSNLAGYVSWGVHGGFNSDYATNMEITFGDKSSWYLIQTVESYNGRRVDPGQGTFIKWFSSNAFGGTNFVNTPVGAVTHVEEPGCACLINNSSVYFGLWASGRIFGSCAWTSLRTPALQVIGDPLVVK